MMFSMSKIIKQICNGKIDEENGVEYHQVVAKKQ